MTLMGGLLRRMPFYCTALVMGFMAGCGLPVALLRAHLREAALAVGAVDRAADRERQGGLALVPVEARVRRYVDDWVVWARGTAEQAAEAATGAYHALVAKLGEASMLINLTKTAVVASTAACARAARATFASAGTPVLPSVRDLGVDVC
ncbi:MAG: hypothetical protein ACKPKO_10295, partial [Candidatus Fonsibacter sp.]